MRFCSSKVEESYSLFFFLIFLSSSWITAFVSDGTTQLERLSNNFFLISSETLLIFNSFCYYRLMFWISLSVYLTGFSLSPSLLSISTVSVFFLYFLSVCSLIFSSTNSTVLSIYVGSFFTGDIFFFFFSTPTVRRLRHFVYSSAFSAWLNFGGGEASFVVVSLSEVKKWPFVYSDACWTLFCLLWTYSSCIIGLRFIFFILFSWFF